MEFFNSDLIDSVMLEIAPVIGSLIDTSICALVLSGNMFSPVGLMAEHILLFFGIGV